MNDMHRFASKSLLPMVLACCAAAALAQSSRSGDYIVAVVNQELVTAGEINLRVARLREQMARGGSKVPPEAELRQQVLDSLIDERVLTTYARDSGQKVEDPELDRAVQGVAAQNQLTMVELRERLKIEGLDLPHFRTNLRDNMLVERVREREVGARIRITDEDIDKFVAQQVASSGAEPEMNVAQILVSVADGATPELEAQRRARAEQALARVRAGEDFAVVAKQMSEDSARERGGAMGMRQLSRLPDAFVEALRGIKPGELAPTLLRSGAGFHVLKVLDRRDPDPGRVTQTQARHILLRTSPQLKPEVAARRLNEFRSQIESGRKTFEELAKANSEDGSAPAGGDLGWAYPGQFVPEFEEAMNRLSPGGISPPVSSRFGVHLIQVVARREVTLETKQVREQARSALREQKFEQAYLDWTRELRARAYIEMREPPQ